MADEEDRMVTTQPGWQGQGETDPADDWLSGDVDWGEAGELPAQTRSGRRGGSSEAATAVSGPGGQAVPDDIRRRRAIALVAVVGGIIVIVVIAMVAFGGGSKSPTTPPVTTPAVTTPAQTTTGTTTTTSTNPSTPSGGTGTVKLPASGSLKQGDTGAEVKALQQALNAVGSASLTVDGNFGPATTAAVIAFQTANGLTADGVVGSTTAKALNDALAQSAP